MLLKRLLGENVELELEHGRDLWPVKADVNQFEQVIINLAVNARDAMPDGGKLAIRTAQCRGRRRRARLNLQGMPPAEYVLIEVSRHRHRHAAGGDGEDLRAVLHHQGGRQGHRPRPLDRLRHRQADGGFIYVDRRVGQGTTFRVYLPRYIADRRGGGREPKVEPEVKKPATDLTGQGTMLLVEDEDPVRAFAARALRPAATRCSRRPPASRRWR